jgi:uncharacterized protein
MMTAQRTIAVALHDIEPATFERCALIRDWLYDHGVGRATLLVIPARDLHPLAERSPEMVEWLIKRERSGDAIAQHGFQHLRSQRTRGRTGGAYQSLRTLSADRESEFVGLDAHETRRAVDAGRRVLKLAGIEPRGFVAPGYAYTPALRQTLSERFQWWAALMGLHRTQPAGMPLAERASGGWSPRWPRRQSSPSSRRRELLGPPIALSSTGKLGRTVSPYYAPERSRLARRYDSTSTLPTSTTQAICSRLSGCSSEQPQLARRSPTSSWRRALL